MVPVPGRFPWYVPRRVWPALAFLALLAASLGVHTGTTPHRPAPGGAGGGPGIGARARPHVRSRPSATSLAGLAQSLPAPRLPPYGDRVWWQAAVATQHWPDPAAFRLVLDPGRRPSVIVFVYHQVCPANWPLRNGPDFITPARLAAEFRFFRAHHIATLTPAQFLAFLNGRRAVPPGSVFLTFDNGLEGVYRFAYPLARLYGVHITTFLIGDRVHAVWRPGEKYLGWNQVVAMAKSGYVGIESETYDLHFNETVAPRRYGPAINVQWETYPAGHYETYAAYVRRVRRAFLDQRLVFLRHLGQAPTLLVWPFSTYNRVAQLEARAAGYQAAFAVYPGLVTAGDGLDRYALPRNPATFMWDNVPEEYDDLRAGRLRMVWPPSPTLLTEARHESQSTT
jgi:hypothetical protein